MRLDLENKIARLSSYVVGAIIVLAPFWAFVTVWSGSNFGHYTALRLIIEALLALVILAAISLMLLDRKLAAGLMRRKWIWPLAAFVTLEIIWGIVAHFEGNVSLKALGYAWIIDLRYLLFFASVYLIAEKDNWLAKNWKRLVFLPALAVSIFAVLQFAVLPLNFLSHFGYSPHTIFPYETINHNHSYPRAMSFTRGSNPLGAYLLIIISLAVLFLVKAKKNKPKIFYSISALLGLAALAFSFSRSAWAGTVVSLILLIFLIFTSTRARKIMLASGALLIVVAAILFAGFHNNPHFQNYFSHTQKNSVIKTTSDAQHASALTNGFSDFAHQPLGKGPGTSGPASVYNYDAAARNTENYYLQIGEEDGWLGLALLLAFFVIVAIELARARTKLALALFASFIGLAVTNFLLPAWTDVTLAYVFWGLAAVALIEVKLKNERKANRE